MAYDFDLRVLMGGGTGTARAVVRGELDVAVARARPTALARASRPADIQLVEVGAG